jgi:hypothetical protein
MTSKSRFDKRNLWPWRDWMTIGIAALASDKEEFKATGVWPNRIVMIADTMGSFGDVDSHPRLHKMAFYPEAKLYTVSANQIDRASELDAMIKQCVEGVPFAERTFNDCQNCIAACVFAFKKSLFELTILPQYGVAPKKFDKPTALLPPVLNGPLLEEWKKFDIGCDMLVGVFERHNLPYLFSVDGATATVENISMPGFGAVGIYDKAMFWLSRRAQVLSMGVNRTAYHVYEAKLMGEGSPHVNEHIEFLIAAPDKYWSWSTHRPPMGEPNPPVTLEQLKEWFALYGPKDTEALDKTTAEKASTGGV